MEHQGTGRVFLLVDELIKSEQVATKWPFKILSSIGELLDTYAGFNAVVASLKGHPLFGHVTLTRSERSPVAALVSDLLDV